MLEKPGVVSVRRAATFAITLLACMVASVASAAASEPQGNYKVFNNCPYENTEVRQCVYSETTGGEVVLGNEKVPITKKILLQGGSKLNFETGKEAFFAAKNGETLSKSPQEVPGGLIELLPESSIPWWLRPLYKAVLGVNSTAELAKPASAIEISSTHLAEAEGVALSLPVKIHLENLLLGSNCYVGSSTSPITWNLTAGKTSPPPPNKSIEGSPGDFEFIEESNILKVTGDKLVDNAWSAPAASGCGGLFSIIINPIVDLKVGLPSAAGKNTVILSGNLDRGYAPAVRESVK